MHRIIKAWIRTHATLKPASAPIDLAQ